MFANSANPVMAPRAIAAYATQAVAAQTKLFMEGGKFAYALTLFIGGGLICLGMPFIHWWQHGLQDSWSRLLLVLMLGESLPMSQWLTYSVLLGANHQRVLAFLAVTEAVIAFPLIVVIHAFGRNNRCLHRSGVVWISGARAISVAVWLPSGGCETARLRRACVCACNDRRSAANCGAVSCDSGDSARNVSRNSSYRRRLFRCVCFDSRMCFSWVLSNQDIPNARLRRSVNDVGKRVTHRRQIHLQISAVYVVSSEKWPNGDVKPTE